MFKKIYKQIKKYDTIVIARHIGVDPDALASQLALKESILLSFPNKKVYAVGAGSVKFSYLGSLDKIDKIESYLLIVLDTPDRKRIDFQQVDMASKIVKIDHHPFIDKISEIEYIDTSATSTCEILMQFFKETKLRINQHIAKLLFCGLVSDSNRFLFDTCSSRTFDLVHYYLSKYSFCLSDIYKEMYSRPLKEVRLEGYIASNMQISEHGVGYIYLTNEIIAKFKADSASAGNMINNFNYINEIFIWLIATEDAKNNNIRVNIRSRGPVINKVAEKYHGGGHPMASGARVEKFEEVELLIQELDKVACEYIEKGDTYEN